MGRRLRVGTPGEPAEEIVARVVKHLQNKYKEYSPAEALAMLPERDRLLWLKSLTTREQEVLEYDSNFYLRPNQREPKVPYKILMIVAGRGFGKFLRKDEVLPTPSGYTEIGNIDVGDCVFDENGEICNVVAVYPQGTQKIYKITFSDNTELFAGGDHLWVTWTHAERKAFLRSQYESDTSKFPDNWPCWRSSVSDRHGNIHRSDMGPRIRTTDDIRATIVHGKRRDLNHCIPVTGALQLPDIKTPIDMYLAGYWLGDGHTNCQTITIDPADQQSFISIADGIGHRITHYSDPKSIGLPTLRWGLIAANLLKNKHIPAAWLRGSIQQRLALLQGLMDSDGHCGYSNGYVEFCNTNRALAYGVVELARSLGQKPLIGEYESFLYGVRKKNKFRVKWRPTINPFRLQRKRDAVHDPGSQSLRNMHRMIKSVEYVGDDDAVCITVDSPNSMYLAGRGMIPTHNTYASSSIVRRWIESGEKKHVALVASNAADLRDVVVEPVFKQGSGMLQICPPWNMPHYSPTKRQLTWTNPNYPSYGAVCSLYSAEEPNHLRGPSHDGAWMDEFAKYKYGESVWHMLKLTLRIGKNPQTIISTTPQPVPFLIELLESAAEMEKRGCTDIVVLRGSTYENRANLSPEFLSDIFDTYEGTTLGRQEIYADLVVDVDGALWTKQMIEPFRILPVDGVYPPLHLQKTIIGVDPQVGYTPTSPSKKRNLQVPTQRYGHGSQRMGMTGIIVCGLGRFVSGEVQHAYVLEE